VDFIHALLHKGLKFSQVIDGWVCKVTIQGQGQSIAKRLSSVTSFNKFWGWNMQTDRYVCLPHYAFVLYTLWNKYTKEYVLQCFLLHIWFVVCFMCRVRSLPQCLQPATFPVSMMVMVSTSGPHVQRKMVGTTYLSESLMVWPGHCHSPETCVFVIHHFLCWIFIQSCVSFLNMLHDTYFGVTVLLFCMIWWLKWSFIMQN